MDSLSLDSLRLTHVRIPLPAASVAGSALNEKDAILVEVKAGGVVGLGEASPPAEPGGSGPSAEMTWKLLVERLIPRMEEAGELDLGGEWFAGAVDDPHATCAVDTALWDLAARKRGLPLWALLGGRADHAIESVLSLGPGANIAELLEQIEDGTRSEGYRHLKLAVRPGWDDEPIQAIRIRFGRMPLIVDGGCAYTREHLDHLAAWDRFGLTLIEQPFPRDDLEGHAQLSSRCRTPVVLDESGESPTAVRQALRLRAGRVLSIKLQRLGGLAAALRVHALSEEGDLPCRVSSMSELGVGSHAAIHLATLPRVLPAIDVEASHRWLSGEVTEPAVGCHNGALMLPGGAGLGVRLNAEVVRRYKVRDHSAELGCRLGLRLAPAG